MRVVLEDAEALRGTFRLAARAVFTPGTHLVGGAVGSGKSTLALLMAGLLHPSRGRVTFDGVFSRLLSLQFPEYHLTGTTLAGECASWGLCPAPILAAAGLAGRDGCDPLSLSRGELKRLVLACILARPCDLLLLDEPFSGLDCHEKAALCSRLERHPAGIMVIFTHEEEFLPPVGRLWEVRDGALHGRGQGRPAGWNDGSGTDDGHEEGRRRRGMP